MKENKKVFDMLIKICRDNRILTYTLFSFCIVLGIIPLAQTRALGRFVDAISSFFSENGSDKDAICLIVLILLCYLIQWIIGTFNGFILKKLECEINAKHRMDLLQKCKYLSLRLLEDSNYYDLHKRVISRNSEMCLALVRNATGIVNISIRFICTLIILYNYKQRIAFLMIALVIPVFVFSFNAGNKSYIESKKLTTEERYLDYLSSVLVNRDAASERNVFSYEKYVNDKYDEAYEKWKIKILKLDFINLIKRNLGTVVSVTMGIVIIFLLLLAVINREVTLGAFVSTVYIVFELSNMLSENLVTVANEYAVVREYIDDVNSYSENNEYISKDQMIVEFNTLEFKNVNFKYDGSDKYILKNLNLIIEKGKQYALVGLNGEGKTTLVKLAVGLYDNYEGNILLNGIDIKKYLREDLNHIMAVLFQDFARYSTSVGENIFMSDVIDTNIELPYADELGMNELLKSLTNGLETKVGKVSADGVDLSGGEWQKVAFTRLLVASTPMIILDEPTAAVDPFAESKLYEFILNVTKNRTSLVISHRLGATKYYDHILVLNDGKIVEQGKHEELMKIKGLYYNMYESQKEWYA